MGQDEFNSVETLRIRVEHLEQHEKTCSAGVKEELSAIIRKLEVLPLLKSNVEDLSITVSKVSEVVDEVYDRMHVDNGRKSFQSQIKDNSNDIEVLKQESRNRRKLVSSCIIAVITGFISMMFTIGTSLATSNLIKTYSAQNPSIVSSR